MLFQTHKNLTYYQTAQNLDRRQVCWSLTLSEYDIKLIHTPGHKMIQSDALSRRPDLCPEEDKEVIVLSNKLFINLVDLELQKKILSSEDYDTEATDTIKPLIEDGPTNLQKELGAWAVQEINRKNLLFF